MTKEKALEWLDLEVLAYKILYRSLSESVYDLEKNSMHEVQITGVKELADAAELPYTVCPWDGNERIGTNKNKVSIEYGGFKFFELAER